jgi:Protein of unknown function (DUF1572)
LKNVTIRKEEHTLFQAIHRSLTHALSRWPDRVPLQIGKEGWQWITIPPGQSQQVKDEGGKSEVADTQHLITSGTVSKALSTAKEINAWFSKRHRSLVAGASTLLRRFAPGADMGLLAASAAYLPSPHAGSEVAQAGRSACPGDLRTFRRRQMERGRPDVLSWRRQNGVSDRLVCACEIVKEWT